MAMESIEIDFLVLTILEEEMKALNQYGFQAKVDSTGRAYHVLSVNNVAMGRNVVVIHYCVGSPGNVVSAALVSQLLNEWHPKCVVVLGIAAGIRTNDAQVGDILVSTNVTYYSMTKETRESTERRPDSFPSDPILVSQMRSLSEGILGSILASINKMGLSTRMKPKLLFGPLLSGESVMKAEEKLADLLRLQPRAVGVEMESYGVYRACAEHGSRPRVITIRCVSDFGDSQKSDTYHQLAAISASLCFLTFASACNLNHLEGLPLGIPSVKETPYLSGTQTTSRDVFTAQADGAAETQFKIRGVSPLLDFRLLPHIVSFWKLARITPIGGSRLQVGAEVTVSGILSRTTVIGWSALRMNCVLVDPYFSIVASSPVEVRSLLSLFDPLQIEVSMSRNKNQHYNLLGLLGLEYRTRQAEAYYAGVYFECALLRGGSVTGLQSNASLVAKIGDIETATY